MITSTYRVTFIVRLWADGNPTDESSWRGIAEQVGTDRQCKFQTFEALLDWMRREIVQNQADPPLSELKG